MTSRIYLDIRTRPNFSLPPNPQVSGAYPVKSLFLAFSADDLVNSSSARLPEALGSVPAHSLQTIAASRILPSARLTGP